jgi:hypothetical protein
MSILENIKDYFSAKSAGKEIKKAPKGICPNCWGKEEWDGEFYKLKKGNRLVGNDQTYNNFINKIVESTISGIVINKDSYQYETCKTSYS